MKWRIYYSDQHVEGSTQQEWFAAPDTDVQVVVVFDPYEAPHESPHVGVWDRRLFHGVDEYDPFGWGVKHGAWTSKENYECIYEEASRACR